VNGTHALLSPQAREERKSSLRSIASLADVDDEPLFCFETALKTCYWCVMVAPFEQ
jgi:hypothetical protein